MKKHFYKSISLLTLLTLLLLGIHQPLRACVQQHDSVYVTVHYETPGNTDISLTLTNLRLATGTPNEFCSCGITHFTNIFSQILYVAFVDSGTTNPYPGFDVWDPSANASNAWNGVVSTGSWNAFVSHVNTAGLAFNHPVELIIRARLQPGYTYTYVDSTLYISNLGTDAWDNSNQILGNMHQDVSGFQNNHTLIPEGPGSTYFADLDAALMTHRENAQPAYSIDVFPVPARDRLYVRTPDPLNPILSWELIDGMGRLVANASGLHDQQTEIETAALSPGTYFLKMTSAKGLLTRKFTKLDE